MTVDTWPGEPSPYCGACGWAMVSILEDRPSPRKVVPVATGAVPVPPRPPPPAPLPPRPAANPKKAPERRKGPVSAPSGPLLDEPGGESLEGLLNL